jgi:hypothetical protein
MSIELNHAIVWATEREASAGFLAGILGIPLRPVAGPFRQVQVANGVTLDSLHATATNFPACRLARLCALLPRYCHLNRNGDSASVRGRQTCHPRSRLIGDLAAGALEAL